MGHSNEINGGPVHIFETRHLASLPTFLSANVEVPIVNRGEGGETFIEMVCDRCPKD